MSLLRTGARSSRSRRKKKRNKPKVARPTEEGKNGSEEAAPEEQQTEPDAAEEERRARKERAKYIIRQRAINEATEQEREHYLWLRDRKPEGGSWRQQKNERLKNAAEKENYIKFLIEKWKERLPKRRENLRRFLQAIGGTVLFVKTDSEITLLCKEEPNERTWVMCVEINTKKNTITTYEAKGRLQRSKTINYYTTLAVQRTEQYLIVRTSGKEYVFNINNSPRENRTPNS